jgi:hypothetical protein
MSITISNGITTLELDPDLYWEDEHAWSPVAQTMTRSVTGAAIFQAGLRTAGRPITLRPYASDSAWMPLSTLQQLRAWMSVPGAVFTLTIHGVPYKVRARHGSGETDSAHVADPVVFYSDPVGGDWMLVTLRFITTE